MSYPYPLKIAGVGRYLPERIVSSEELAPRCGLEPGWIERKQGVRERRWVTTETASEMGAAAGREAVEDAWLALGDIDLILNASGTPEQTIPDGAPLIQRHLGLGDSGVACLSVHATCLSFLVGLDLCASLLATERYRNILLVSSDITSVGLNFSHPESSTLFGDAAAAAVLTRTPEGERSALHASRLETYGDGAEYTQIPGGGTRKHPNFDDTKPEDNLFHVDGPSVFKMAIQYGPRFLERLQPGILGGLGDIKLVVPHQASKLALDAHDMMGMPREQVMRTIERFGNCVAASIPVTLYEAIREERMVRGDKVLLVGTGAGLSLGGAILTY